jgi:hypothetical protein
VQVGLGQALEYDGGVHQLRLDELGDEADVLLAEGGELGHRQVVPLEERGEDAGPFAPAGTGCVMSRSCQPTGRLAVSTWMPSA